MNANELIALLQALKEPNGQLSEKAENLKEKAIDALALRLERENSNDDDDLQGSNGEKPVGPEPIPGAKNLPF